MTIKQIVELTGCSRANVSKTAKQLYPEYIKNGIKADFTDGQSIRILDKLRKQGFLASQNEKVPQDYISRELVAVIVAEVLKQLMPQLTTPQLPPVDFRSELNAIIRAYASKNSIFYTLAWVKFYQRVLYRLHINIEQRAKNSGLEPLDWAEKNGYMEQLYSLAREEF